MTRQQHTKVDDQTAASVQASAQASSHCVRHLRTLQRPPALLLSPFSDISECPLTVLRCGLPAQSHLIHAQVSHSCRGMSGISVVAATSSRTGRSGTAKLVLWKSYLGRESGSAG